MEKLRGNVRGDELFGQGPPHSALWGQAARGGAYTVVSQGTRLLFFFLGTSVLARLLSPESFGLVAMAMVLVSFAQTFKDMGLSTATIQRREISQAQISTLFWANALISLCLAAILFCTAGLVASYFDRSELRPVLKVLSFAVLLSGLTIQHQALLRRSMAFGRLASAEVLSALVAWIAAISGALLGAGYWALVIQPLVQILLFFILIWFMCAWTPRLPRRRTGSQSMLQLGLQLTAGQIFNYVASNVDKLLVGKFLGAAVLGPYEKAWQLLLYPITQINRPIGAVVLPLLSRLNGRSEPDYRRAFLVPVAVIVVLAVPTITVLCGLADIIIELWLGPAWIHVVPIFRVLCLRAIVMPVLNASAWLLYSQGRGKDVLYYCLIDLIVRTAAITIALPYGAIGVAAAIVVATIPLATVQSWIVGCRGPVGKASLYRMQLVSVAGFAGPVALLFSGRWLLDAWLPPLASALLSSLLAVAACLAISEAAGRMGLFPLTLGACRSAWRALRRGEGVEAAIATLPCREAT